MKNYIDKRELLIDNKIFTENDLLLLIKLFSELSGEILEKSKEIKHKDLIQQGWKEPNITDRYINTSHSRLEITYSDNSKYAGTFEDTPEINDIPDNKKIVGIDLFFSEKVFDCSFIIKIHHSDSDSSLSYASAEGMGSEFVNRAISSLENFLSTCRNQSVFAIKYKLIIIALTDILLSVILLNLIELFIKTKLFFPKIMDNLFTKYLIFFIIVVALISATPAAYIYKMFKNLFPVIEIRTGNDIHQAEKERRNKIWLITSLIIITTIISFLLRLL